MRFLRTASTGRLLAVIATVIVVAAGGAAIAVAATSSDPVPAPASLAAAVHRALSADPVAGISADISFTDNLIDSSDFTGQSGDPLLAGGSGRLWIDAGGRLRIELQSDDGDVQIVVENRSYWISDPAQHTVYEGTLPAGAASAGPTQSGSAHAVASLAQIQSEITDVMGSADLSAAQPTDVAGRAAYRVTISPRTSGGLVGSAQLAWDAATGVPLDLAVYARGDSSPVLELTATHISYGAVPAADFAISPPAGATVVTIPGAGSGDRGRSGIGAGDRAVHGLRAVAAHVAFTVSAPATLAGMTRRRVSLLGDRSVLISYGSGLGGIAVIESASAPTTASSADRPSAGGLSLPTPTIDGATGSELSTPLGTVVHVAHGGIGYTVIGSVTGATAVQAARGL